MTAVQIAEMTSMSDADVLALAYEEAAGGDIRQALLAAAEDVLMTEARIAATQRLVSRGYVRGVMPAGQD